MPPAADLSTALMRQFTVSDTAIWWYLFALHSNEHFGTAFLEWAPDPQRS